MINVNTKKYDYLRKWVEVKKQIPTKKGLKIYVRHFGYGLEDDWIQHKGIVDEYGIRDIGEGHTKRGTITHWRLDTDDSSLCLVFVSRKICELNANLKNILSPMDGIRAIEATGLLFTVIDSQTTDEDIVYTVVADYPETTTWRVLEDSGNYSLERII